MLKLISLTILFLHFVPSRCIEKIDNFQTIVTYGNYSKNHVISTNISTENIIIYPSSTSKYPYMVYIWSQQTSFDYPVFVVVKQQKYVTSWQIPWLIHTGTGGVLQFASTSKSLCHNNMDLIAQLPRNTNNTPTPEYNDEISVSVSTSSRTDSTIVLRVEWNDLFYVKELEDYKVIAAASHPRYYFYKFPDIHHENYSNSVILEVTSEDTTCMMISIQNASCPVQDNLKDITSTGMFQTVQTKGGIIVKQSEFPNGFFIVIIVKGDNIGCNEVSSTIPKRSTGISKTYNYTTTVTFQIKPTVSSMAYYIAAFTTLGVIFLFYIVFSLSTWGFYRYSNLWKKSGNITTEEIALQVTGETNSVDCPDTKLAASNLKLSDLARKNPKHFEKKSFSYLWHVISIALFYGIPVVQLVITYQRMVNISGNLDFCYYNFLCAHPYKIISDFNHLYSNIGYVFMGLLFLFITVYRHRFLIHRQGYGIPKHYGLFYAMGIALIMEGILSASYHVCPNQSNFQFDTSFMYVMAALCMVQLYQKRHPDVNASAYATFVALGIAIFAAMLGVLNGHIALWIVFIIVYISFCLYVSFNIYFVSYVRMGFKNIYYEWNVDRNVRKVFGPKRKAHFIILVVANILNIILACMGILCYFFGTDFATFLLGLLMGNTVMYAIVYIVMKFVHREKICFQPALFGILGLIVWACSAYFFVSNTSLWSVSAAESKEYNKHCILLDFYDNHDVWHLLSAPALFFSFMLLLTLDDDLINTPHADIMVF